MKDEWQIDQWRANAKQPSVELQVEKPEIVWRRRARAGTEEWITPLKNGDILMVSAGRNQCLSVYGPQFKRGKRLSRAQTPMYPIITCSLFDGIFAILDEDEDEVIQTLSTHNARTDERGENSIEFTLELIGCMMTLRLNTSTVLIIMGNSSGDLITAHYRDGVLKNLERIARVHKDSIYGIASSGHRFCVTSHDGSVTAWDAFSKNLLGRIENPRLVDLGMNSDYIFTDIDSVLRIYENKPGLKLKFVVKLPALGPSVNFAACEHLSGNVGVLHDEHGTITFFDLFLGTPLYRMKSPFKSVNSCCVLADASLFLTSSVQRDGHAIIRVTEPRYIYDALCEYVSNNYAVTVDDIRVLEKQRKCRKWLCIASAVIGGIKLGECILKIS